VRPFFAPALVAVGLLGCSSDTSAPGYLSELEAQLALCAGSADACARRVSEGGYDYGWCDVFVLTVVLIPEPCDVSNKSAAAARPF
jgi:hypothetical protein